MTPIDPSAATELADRACLAGAEVATERFRTDLEVREKRGSMDPVTAADGAAQAAIIDVLHGEAVPGVIVGEEGGAEKAVPENGSVWVIDPIDGTNNYARGNRCWAVCVAYCHDGRTVAGAIRTPLLGDRFTTGPDGALRNGEPIAVSDRDDLGTLLGTAIFGLAREARGRYAAMTGTLLRHCGDLRQYGSGQVALASLAAGELDVAVSTDQLSPWDTLVGVDLVRRAGGIVTDLQGRPWRHESAGLVATNGPCHDRIVDLVTDVIE